ncbi:uncharacterized protein LOC143768887 [Ranitomeya variabilis]|uniref:uncharacterized protein LOC143768887 n=1 Tax=Ranitomeya variabilis TaxID=490064 RepID=UPI00405799F0
MSGVSTVPGKDSQYGKRSDRARQTSYAFRSPGKAITSRELHQLMADKTWMSRPESKGHATIAHQLRSSQRDQRRPITTDGHRTDTTAITARGRQVRTPLWQRGQESRERSRSPLRPVPAELSREVSESRRDDSGSSDTATEIEFRWPFPVPPNPRPKEFPAASGSPVQLASKTQDRIL